MVAEVLGGWLPLTARVMAAAAGAAAWASAGGAAAAAVGGTDEVLGVALRLLACKDVQVGGYGRVGGCEMGGLGVLGGWHWGSGGVRMGLLLSLLGRGNQDDLKDGVGAQCQLQPHHHLQSPHSRPTPNSTQVNTSKIGACGGDDELEPHRRTPAGRATGWSVLKVGWGESIQYETQDHRAWGAAGRAGRQGTRG